MRAANWGPIFANDGTADTLSNTLITVNMSNTVGETWTNSTFSNAHARAGAEIQWLPVADQGVLVAVGGVIDPVDLTVVQALNDSQIAASVGIQVLSPTSQQR